METYPIYWPQFYNSMYSGLRRITMHNATCRKNINIQPQDFIIPLLMNLTC